MTTEAQAEGAVGIAVDGADNVYVLDPATCRVKKYSPSGEFVGEWSCAGQGDLNVQRSVGVTVDGAGNVYLMDAFFAGHSDGTRGIRPDEDRVALAEAILATKGQDR